MSVEAAEESPVAPVDRAPDLPRPPAARLTDEQRRQFERDGFLVIPEALPPAMVERLLAVVDRLYDQGLREQGLSETNRWEMRNCLPADDLFLELVDWPSTFPLVVDLMNWNIHLITSWLMVRAPGPPAWKGAGWHRTGGTAAWELHEPRP